MIADTAGVGAALEVRPRNNGVANPGPEGPGDAVAQEPLEMQLSRGGLEMQLSRGYPIHWLGLCLCLNYRIDSDYHLVFQMQNLHRPT